MDQNNSSSDKHLSNVQKTLSDVKHVIKKNGQLYYKKRIAWRRETKRKHYMKYYLEEYKKKLIQESVEENKEND